MLASLRPKSYPRYLSLPILGPVVAEFAAWSRSRGYTRGTIRNQLKDVRLIEDYFQKKDFRCLDDLTQAALEKAWRDYRHRSPSTAGTIRQIECFLLETRSLEPLAVQPKSHTELELERFTEHLESVRGLEASTVAHHCAYLQRFLQFLGYEEAREALEVITPRDVERFIKSLEGSLNRYSLQHVIGYVRAFLRFEYETGTLSKPLHTMIDTPRIYRLERLPCHLPWETVRQLLHSIDRSDFSGLRDHAMLYLMAGYGLRSCEVVSLTLDDIDWRKSTLRIAQRKTRNQLSLPLTDAAGEVLIGYLKKRKQDLPYRELFLRVRAPSGTLKPTGVVEAFQHRVRRSGLTIAYQGPHCLRHSYAVHLLRQGASVKAIGDLLGHRDAESTCIYLRLATEDLRLVALPVPRGAKDSRPIAIGPVGPFSKLGPRREKPRQAQSFLAPEIEDYLALKRVLGREYSQEASILYDFDAFVAIRQEMNGEIFCQWAATLELLSANVRRNWMRIVRNLCLYRLRSDPGSFVPDRMSFPVPRQSLKPWILKESDIGRLLSAAQHLRPSTKSPLRPEAVRVGILLLYSAGLRRGELLRLTLGDFNPAEGTLLIRATKFHKTRLIPLSPDVCSELGAYLALRSKKRLPMEDGSALIWNGHGGDGSYTGTGFAHNWCALCKALEIFTDKGKPPRIHDLRHSFAVQVLRRSYLDGGDVQAKLPLLSIYMGHVSIVSTHYYLPFVEEIRTEASDRFHRSFGVQLLG